MTEYQQTLINGLKTLEKLSLWPQKRKTPETLEQCHEWLEKILSPEEVSQIKSSSLVDLCKYHHSIGRWIRNTWMLWKGGALKSHMESLGFTHPDDMSSVILDSFWSKLNGQFFDLEKVAKEYRAYWEASKTGYHQIALIKVAKSLNSLQKPPPNLPRTNLDQLPPQSQELPTLGLGKEF